MYHRITDEGEFEPGSNASGQKVTQSLVARLYGVPMDDLFAATRRGARAAFARQVAMYLMRVVYRLSLKEIGLAFGRDRSTASHACQLVEELREDPAIDRQLAQLENLLRGAAESETAQ